MTSTSDKKFSAQIGVIYKEIEKQLVALAHRYRAPRPQAAVDEWFSRAYEIVLRFDTGDLQPKVKVDKDMVPYNPEIHPDEMFLVELKRYLKQAFINDLLKAYHHNKKMVSDNDNVAASQVANYAATSAESSIRPIFKYDVIQLDSLIKILEYDLDKNEGSMSCMVDVIHGNFVKAVLSFAKNLSTRPEWQDQAVVTDIDEKDNKKFFANDFRSELEDGVRKELCKQILSEENPIIIEKLAKLVQVEPKECKAALQKRLFRYLYEFRGGIPARMRKRMKNKTL